MIITDDYIFIHIPKTAGTSIERVLNQTQQVKTKLITKQRFRGHISTKELQAAIGPAEMLSRFKFVVVRNTWDRILSLYSHITQTGVTSSNVSLENKTIKKYFTKMGFNNWVVNELKQLKNPSWKQNTSQQITWITPSVDYVIRFEQLNKGFQTVCDKLNIICELEHVTKNKTSHAPYQEVYNNEAREYISVRYSQDIEQFNHKF